MIAMSLWSRQTFGRPDKSSGRSVGGHKPGDVTRPDAAGDRNTVQRGDGATDDDRQRSQRLAAAKQFDLDGQIG
jgi:hypothetical protein